MLLFLCNRTIIHEVHLVMILNGIRFIIFKYVVFTVSFLVSEISLVLLPTSLWSFCIIESFRIFPIQNTLCFNIIPANAKITLGLDL